MKEAFENSLKRQREDGFAFTEPQMKININIIKGLCSNTVHGPYNLNSKNFVVFIDGEGLILRSESPI